MSYQPKPGGMAQVLRIAWPLILASSGHAFRLFADRVMLARYSQSAIAAAMPAGLTCFCLMSIFIGTASYVSTFVAQYQGAGQVKRTGLAVWQGLYVALTGGLVVGLLAPTGALIFNWMGHGPEVIEQQVIYFQVLARLSFAGIMLAAVNGFWTGRGKTRVVMCIELFCSVANILLNQALIFGDWGCPELGILGAGLATGISNMLGLAIALALFLAPGNRTHFGTWPQRTFAPNVFRRLMRYGSPNGIQFALDLIAFNLFIVILGRLGAVELEAANIAFAVNSLAFLPLIGLGMTVSILVGQGIGRSNVALAKRSVRSALNLAFIYNTILAGGFIVFPALILAVFARNNDLGQSAALKLAAVYMRFISVYLMFDGLYIIYSHAIRGAGDTRFAMYTGTAISWLTLVLPCFIAQAMGAGAMVLWGILVAHIMIAGMVFLWRYRAGHWMQMRVIEEFPPL